MKKFIVILSLLIAMPVMAEETNGLLYNNQSENIPSTGSINMTPKNTFSGYTKSNDIRNKYPNWNRGTFSQSQDYQRAQMMKTKSVKEISNTGNLSKDSDIPLMFNNQLPQKYTNEDMMRVNAIQNGIQNMYMNF